MKAEDLKRYIESDYDSFTESKTSFDVAANRDNVINKYLEKVGTLSKEINTELKELQSENKMTR